MGVQTPQRAARRVSCRESPARQQLDRRSQARRVLRPGICVRSRDPLRFGERRPALLNKDANQAVETRIEIRDWPRKAAVEVHEVRADSYLAENTIERPDTVKLADPQTLQLALTGTMTYRLKPNSLVVLRFEGASGE
ncbi:MAG: hypothetical protein O3C40_35655 [Planctomycetota bacterium]|nr:hypothetical protein [Planctomycetota bacterium]